MRIVLSPGTSLGLAGAHGLDVISAPADDGAAPVRTGRSRRAEEAEPMAPDGYVDQDAVLSVLRRLPRRPAGGPRPGPAHRRGEPGRPRGPPARPAARRQPARPARPGPPGGRRRAHRGGARRGAVPRRAGPGGGRLVRPGVRDLARPDRDALARRGRHRAGSRRRGDRHHHGRPRRDPREQRVRRRPTDASRAPARSCCGSRARCCPPRSPSSPASTSRRRTWWQGWSRRPAATGSTPRRSPTGACP